MYIYKQNQLPPISYNGENSEGGRGDEGEDEDVYNEVRKSIHDANKNDKQQQSEKENQFEREDNDD